MNISLYHLALDRSGGKPLYRQVYEALKAQIEQQDLSGGTQLPANRLLAKQLGISRNTLVAALDQLVAEGYLISRRGAGVFVSMRNPDHFLVPERVESVAAKRLAVEAQSPNLTAVIPGRLKPGASESSANRSFTVGLPDLDQFPFNQWRRLQARIMRESGRGMLGYSDPHGVAGLRVEVARYVSSARAVKCSVDQVLITAGLQQGLDLMSRLLLRPGDRVAIENPGYPGARVAFTNAGAELLAMPVDESGLIVEQLGLRENIRLAYVTPAHQYPLGGAMPVNRRLQLLQWASERRSWLVEDDYDSEFQFQNRPIPSLQGLGGQRNVIYMGSFSKVLFPGLRIGYLVLPQALVESACALKQSVYGGQPSTDQHVLAEFMNNGMFASHLKRMRSLYARKVALLIWEAQRQLGDRVEIRGGASGMHLVLCMHQEVDDRNLVRRFRLAGFESSALSDHDLNGLAKGLVLGFACADDADIKSGINTLVALLDAPTR